MLGYIIRASNKETLKKLLDEKKIETLDWKDKIQNINSIEILWAILSKKTGLDQSDQYEHSKM